MGSESQPKLYWLDIVLCESIQYTTPTPNQGIYELSSGSRNFMSLGPIPSEERVETICDLKKYIQRKFQITLLISLYGSNGNCLQNSKSVHALRQHGSLVVRPADTSRCISTPNSSLRAPRLNCSMSPISSRLNSSTNTTVTSSVILLDESDAAAEAINISDSDTNADDVLSNTDDADDTLVTTVNNNTARKKLNFPAKEMTYSKWRLLEIQESIKQFMNDGDSEDKESFKKWIFEFFKDVKPTGPSNVSNSQIIVRKLALNERDSNVTPQSVRDVSGIANLFEKVAIVKPADAPELIGDAALNLDMADSRSRNEENEDTRIGNNAINFHSNTSDNTRTASFIMEKMKHKPWQKRELKSKWRVEKLKFLFSCIEIFRNKKNLSWEEIFPQLKSPQLMAELVKDHYPSKAFNMAKLRAFVKFVNHQQRDHPKLREELATILIGLGAPKNLAEKYIDYKKVKNYVGEENGSF